MTTVTVDFYKKSGKWYTSETFKTGSSVWDATEIMFEIAVKYHRLSEMNYTFTTESEQNETMKRMVIR